MHRSHLALVLAPVVFVVAVSLCAQASLPVPELHWVSPDRPAPGDAVVLAGSDLGQA